VFRESLNCPKLLRDVKGVDIFMVVVKKGMLKSSIGAVNQNKKQEEEEVGLSPSSDTKGGNTNNNPPVSSLMMNDNESIRDKIYHR
jgi:hypothetical protein